MTSPRFPLPVRAALTLAAMLAAAYSGLLAVLLPPGIGQAVAMHACAAVSGLGLAVALVRGVDRRPVAALGLGRPALPACLAALAVTAACLAAGTVLAVVFGLTTRTTQPAPALVLVLTQSLLLQAFPEEVLFRGYLVQTALGRLPLWGVTALSTLLFGLPHLLSRSDASTAAQQVLYLLVPIGFGLLATAFRLLTGSVWPAVTVHGTLHLSVSVATLWVTPRPGTYGAYLAIVGGILVAAGLAATRVAIARATRPSPVAQVVYSGIALRSTSRPWL